MSLQSAFSTNQAIDNGDGAESSDQFGNVLYEFQGRYSEAATQRATKDLALAISTQYQQIRKTTHSYLCRTEFQFMILKLALPGQSRRFEARSLARSAVNTTSQLTQPVEVTSGQG
jgi:hypothetical protein